MEKIPRLSTQQRSDLVAYLDGELDEANGREIERILAHSPVARNEVEVLMRTWEMLDHLPRQGAAEDFTQRTMTTIRIAEHREPLSEKAWFQKARRGAVVAGWLAGLLAAAVFGFLVTNRWIPVQTEQLVEELPLIQELHIYAEVDDIDFVKDLKRSGLFDAEIAKKKQTDVAGNVDGSEQTDEPKIDESKQE